MTIKLVVPSGMDLKILEVQAEPVGDQEALEVAQEVAALQSEELTEEPESESKETQKMSQPPT